LRILLVIHGYPIRYNAGSEVYTQSLAHELSLLHEVHVFTRHENSFLPEYHYSVEHDPCNVRVKLHLVNMARAKDRYRHEEVDRLFGCLLDRLKPDMVHIGHLNHLSTSLVFEAYTRGIPIVYTLHDFWLLCPRGQFIQAYPANPTDVWALCDGQEDCKCAQRCYPRYYSGAPEDLDTDIAYWTGWVYRRMNHVRQLCEVIDVFVTPSMYLRDQFARDFEIPTNKMPYLDYGFDLERLSRRNRIPERRFTFGYIGTHIPAKGVHLLIDAYGQLEGNYGLRIWGRHRGAETNGLEFLVQALPEHIRDTIEWEGEYRNQDIVSSVFNACDAIIVPSIWAENSPLVIHEALQARVPVITARYGGMREYVEHGVNGLLFDHRDATSLSRQMARLAEDPELAQRLGTRGYLQSPDGNVPSIEDHTRSMIEIYRKAITERRGGPHAN
jgi:glycosyltransferase involved in cell wall biosynthesis